MMAAEYNKSPACAEVSVKFHLPVVACGDAVLRIKVEENRVITPLFKTAVYLVGSGLVLAAMTDKYRTHNRP